MNFEYALSVLRDEQQPITHRVLSLLSGPSRAECAAFVAELNRLTPERKREVVAGLVESAEANFELDYVGLLRCLLDDQDATIRRQAIEGLWEDSAVDLIAQLVRKLQEDPDVAVRAAAATSLGRYIYDGECELLEERHMVRVRTALERAIEDPHEDLDVVRRAIEAISYIDDTRVRAYIDRAYEHGDARMRESAVFAMGRNADAIWADAVLGELESPSPAMRYEAARASGEMQLKRAVEPLIGLAQGTDREVQEMSIWALGQIGGKRARAALERWATSTDEALSAAANEALEELSFMAGAMDLLLYEQTDTAEAEALLSMFSDEQEDADDDLDDYDDDDDDIDDNDDLEWYDDLLDLE